MAVTPPPAYLATIRGIDKFTEYTAYVFCLLNIPLIASNTYEVISRYVFNEPTEWALDVTTQSFGSMFMLGASYALMKGAHVRTDMLWEKFSDRKKGAIDAIAYVIFFMPTMLVLVYISYDDFLYSMDIGAIVAASLAIFFLSLAGIPLTGGFLAKLFMIKAALSYQPWLAIVAVVMAVVSVFYYFRVIQAMYFRSADQVTQPEFPKAFPALLLITALLVVLLGIFPEALLGLLYF